MKNKSIQGQEGIADMSISHQGEGLFFSYIFSSVNPELLLSCKSHIANRDVMRSELQVKNLVFTSNPSREILFFDIRVSGGGAVGHSSHATFASRMAR